MSDPRLRITNLSDHAGYWQATVTCQGEKVEVDRRYGSWQALVPHDDIERVARCEVPRWVAEALQGKVRPIERAARRAAAHAAAVDDMSWPTERAA